LFGCWLLPHLFFIDKKTIVIERQAILPLTNTFLWLRGVSIFCEVHADPKEEIRYLQKSRLEKLLLRILYIFEWYNWRLAKGMIYNNPLLQKQLQKTLPKPSVAIYNGCDTSRFIIMNSSACRKKLSLPADKNTF
jgi:glycosyltransferase involved in cell wall biosynthesis